MIEAFVAKSQHAAAQLSSAILLYEDPSRNATAFATVHSIDKIGPSFQIMPGRPMKQADLSALYVGLTETSNLSRVKWLHDAVLAEGPDRLIWWTPPQKRALFFKKSTMVKGTFDGSNVCPLPAMVWMAVPGRGLWVYAIKGDKRPVQSTQLYQAPLFNVWSRGKVCAGNAPLPKEADASDPTPWERFLFNSLFTHPNFTQKNRLVKGRSPCAFWSAMVKSPEETFPDGVLVPFSHKVGDLVNPLILDAFNAIPRATGEF